MALAQQKADRNKIHGEPRGGGVPGGNSDSDNVDSTDCNSESSSGSKCHELGYLPDLPSSSSSSSSSSSVPSGPAFTPSAPERRQGPLLHSLREEKVTMSVTKPQHK